MVEVADSYLPEHGDTGYRVTHYDLELDYKPGPGRLTGHAVLSAVADKNLPRFAVDFAAFRISKVLVNGQRAAYRHGQGKLRIRPARAIGAGTPFTVLVHYAGTPQPVRTPHWGEVGWDQLDDGALVASQPIGAPSWFPCNDRVSDKASYRIAVTAPSPYTVVANGKLVDGRVQASTTTWVYDQLAPMAPYLASVQIGRYEHIELGHDQSAAVPLHLVPLFRHDFGRQPQMMTLFTELFGEYPFDGYTVVVTEDELEVPVEAQGMSTFGSNHVDGVRGFERLVAHELAHQWFGNSVGLADWRHIWLNEGFASYAEWLWSEHSGGPKAATMAQRTRALLATRPQDIAIGHPGVARMFDDRVYKRGALTLHALRTRVGDSAFFELLREWTTRHRHGTATTDDFRALAGQDDLLDAWLNHPRLP